MQVKLLTKYSLLTDCQRRARQLNDALKTATAQVLIALRTSCDADILSQQIKQWTSVKHELVKNLQNEEKMPERSRFVIFIVIVSFALSCTTMNCCFVVSMYQQNPFQFLFSWNIFMVYSNMLLLVMAGVSYPPPFTYRGRKRDSLSDYHLCSYVEIEQGYGSNDHHQTTIKCISNATCGLNQH